MLTAASATPLASFTAELRKDIDAVQAALDLPWTTSPVEGQIGRIKMLKRTMYSRAGFELLRARVLRLNSSSSTETAGEPKLLRPFQLKAAERKSLTGAAG